jgi:hypothetical protein
MPLNRFFDNFSNFDSNKGIVGDFTHAANVYRRNNFRLAPKSKFLYHVVVDVNQTALNTLGRSVSNRLNKREFNILASSADLPTYTVNTETLIQYNRKKNSQTMINYNPVGIEFHDDAAGLTTLLWEAYYRYYYEDGNYADQGTKPRAYYTGMYDSEPQNTYRHGFNRSRPDIPFFNSITIHQLHHQNVDSHFTSFTLVNPIIQEWQHDRVDQSDGAGIMKNMMRINYEAVLYDRGYTEDGNPAGFADDAHYDKSPSPYNSISTSAIDNAINSTDEGWVGLFKDIFDTIVGLTDINTQQQEDLRNPVPFQPINVNQVTPINSFNLFPVNNQNTNNIQADPVQTLQTESLATQEFVRQLNSNPKKLADFGKNKASVSIAISSGLNVQESKAFYDSLSPSVKLGIEQAALTNAAELSTKGFSPRFEQSLSDLNII